jgi:hypothetical protein
MRISDLRGQKGSMRLHEIRKKAKRFCDINHLETVNLFTTITKRQTLPPMHPEKSPIPERKRSSFAQVEDASSFRKQLPGRQPSMNLKQS